MFSFLYNIRKNRTIVTCTCTLRKTQYLHIDNFLHYFSLLEMHWNYTVVDPAGESERVSLLPVFDRLDLICLQFPPGIFGIRPCNCLLKCMFCAGTTGIYSDLGKFWHFSTPTCIIDNISVAPPLDLKTFDKWRIIFENALFLRNSKIGS